MSKWIMFVALAFIVCFAARVESGEALGTTRNPIMCDGPRGEGWYLSRLRLPNGDKVTWHRVGSFGDNEKDDHILDGYKGSNGDMLFLDMYHPRYIEILAPPNYRILTEWSSEFEYVNGVIHKFGEAEPFTGDVEERSEDFTLKVRIQEGKVAGSLSKFRPNGQLLQKVDFNDQNRYHGVEIWYKEDGTLWATYRFENGVPHGESEFFDDDGKRQTRHYVHGVRQQKKDDVEEQAKGDKPSEGSEGSDNDKK